jgi:hypothetical protein
MNGRRQTSAKQRSRAATATLQFAEQVLHRFGVRTRFAPIDFRHRRSASHGRIPARHASKRISVDNRSTRISIQPRVHIQVSRSDSSTQHITNRYQLAGPDQHYGVRVIRPVERVFQTHQRETVQELRTLLEHTRERDQQIPERSAMTPTATPAHDEQTIQRLTDRVIQSIDRRVIAQRERLGAG